MLECRRNGESSFAVSASVYTPCIHKGREEGRKKEGSGGGWRKGYKEGRGKGGEEKDEEEERETSARACTGPVCLLSAPLPLSAVLIPAIFN